MGDAAKNKSGAARKVRELKIAPPQDSPAFQFPAPGAEDSNYKQLVETTTNLVWSVDAEGRWTFVNKASAQMLGYQPSELLGRYFHETQTPEQGARDLKVFKEVLQGKSYFNYETVHIRKDGSTVDLSFNAVVSRDAQGRVTGTSGTASDITERKRAEEALRILVEGTASATAEKFFRSLVFHLAQAMRTKYAFVGQIIGNDREKVETLAVWWEDHYAEDFIYTIAGTPSETVIGKKIQVYTNDLYLKFPTDQHVMQTQARGYMGAPIFSSNGEPLGVMAVWSEKPLEDWAPAHSIMTIFAARAGAELERIHAEQESQLLHRRLLQSQKMEAIGQLAAGVAHDLNNALGAVVGHLELMRMSPGLSPDLERSATIALGGCERAASLIEQLLGFSRQGKYNLVEVSLGKVVADTIHFLGKVINKDISIVQEGLGEDLFLLADEGQLQQALINLILNAQQAMSERGTITFSFGSQDVLSPERFNPRATGTSFVTLAVTDDGHGIAPENLDKIFEPFFTTKSEGQGTGLGLSMVYGITQNHGGWIEVDSTPHEGTTFTLYFPRIFNTGRAQERELNRKLGSGSGKILIVDDESALVDLTSLFLQRAGLESIGFTAAEQALKWFKTHWREIDLVLLDMKMPQMNGAECFKALRKIDPHAQVVIMSGYIQDRAVQQLLEEGAIHFFQKPVKYPEMMSWILQQQAKRI
ncbi:MAG: PAS domain S-box protein [Oligoflexia bacterium]|nr:PAS domain S-box protein [Oligoflexia bacterium]